MSCNSPIRSPSGARLFRPAAAVPLAAAMLVGCGGDGSAPPEGAPTNLPPVANAGPDLEVTVGQATTLTGSGTDPDGDPLQYAWTLTARPVGSTAALDGAQTATPVLTPDLAGSYELSLVVSDGVLASDPDRAVVTAVEGNAAPVAEAGPDLFAATGSTVTLDGSASFDSNGDPLNYAWSFIAVPVGSQVLLDDPTLVRPSFVPDLAGTYELQLVVDDGQEASAPDRVTVTVGAFAIRVSWMPNPDDPPGYVVLIGDSEATANAVAEVLVQGAPDWDPAAPEVLLDAGTVLGRVGGAGTACLAVSAYSGAGRSLPSATTCVALPR